MRTAETIAEELRATYAEGWEAGRRSVWTYFAPTIEILHDPPLPTDGPTPATAVEAASVAEFGMYKGLMADFREDATVRAEADQVIIDMVLVGTAADGTALHAPVRQTLTIVDGEAVTSLVSLEREVLMQLMAIVQAGGAPNHD